MIKYIKLVLLYLIMPPEEQENKEENETNNQNTQNPQTLEDSIKVLEERLQKIDKSNNYELELIKNQLSELREVKSRYDKLRNNWVTIEAKTKLDGLFKVLWEKTSKYEAIWDHLSSIKTEIAREEGNRNDSLVWRIDVVNLSKIGHVSIKDYYDNFVNFERAFKPTMRDYIEKHIRFERDVFWQKFEKTLENEHMTMFYDIFTIKYLDKIYESDNRSWLELLHNNLSIKKWLMFNKAEVDILIWQTIGEMLKKWIKFPKEETINIKLEWEDKAFPRKIFEIQDRKALEIAYKLQYEIETRIDKLDKENVVEEVEIIKNLIKNFDDHRSIIMSINDWEWTKLEEKLNEKLKHIEITNIWIKIKRVEKIINKLNVDNIKNELDIISLLISTLKNQIVTHKWDLNSKEYDEKLNKIDNLLIEKLLMLYQKKSWVSQIDGRKSIKESDFVLLLRKAVNEKEISSEIMDKIIKKGYDKAFSVEFSTQIWKKSMENLLEYEDKWSKIFSSELKDLIWEDNAKKMFLLSFIESNATSNKVSEAWAMGRFQMLPSIAKKYITPEIIIEAKTKIINEFINKVNSDYVNNKSKMKLKDKTKFKKQRDLKIKNYKEQVEALSDNDMIEKILQDPIFSAKTAAKYLRELIKDEKSKDWSKKPDDIILKAILKYNWSFSNRLNSVSDIEFHVSIWLDELEKKIILKDVKSIIPKPTESQDKTTIEPLEVKKIIDDLAILLDNRKKRLLSNQVSIKDCMEEIRIIHNIFFKSEKAKNGIYNFQILDDYYLYRNFDDKNTIISWIDKYTKTILDQQYMYPEQFASLSDIYNALKDKK